MDTIPITEAKARIAEHESMQETLDIIGDAEAVADLRRSKEDVAAGDIYTDAQVRAELEQRRRLGAQ
jgi:antitoxin YefM